MHFCHSHNSYVYVLLISHFSFLRNTMKICRACFRISDPFIFSYLHAYCTIGCMELAATMTLSRFWNEHKHEQCYKSRSQIDSSNYRKPPKSYLWRMFLIKFKTFVSEMYFSNYNLYYVGNYKNHFLLKILIFLAYPIWFSFDLFSRLVHF